MHSKSIVCRGTYELLVPRDSVACATRFAPCTSMLEAEPAYSNRLLTAIPVAPSTSGWMAHHRGVLSAVTEDLIQLVALTLVVVADEPA